MSNSLREFLRDRSTSWLLGELSAAWNQIVNGVSGDQYIQSAALTHRMGWLLDPESPDDTLALFAAERRMPKYPLESVTAYRARLHQAWEAYKYGGSAFAIESQFAAAGYPGVEVRYFPDRPGPHGEPAPYWSQFWVFMPFGSHPVQAEPHLWGSFNWGDGTLYGPIGLTIEFMQTIRGIVRKWKSVRWVCRGFIFGFPDAIWGGFEYGDGTVWGGSIEIGFGA